VGDFPLPGLRPCLPLQQSPVAYIRRDLCGGGDCIGSSGTGNPRYLYPSLTGNMEVETEFNTVH
jgi:hypothetical protein